SDRWRLWRIMGLQTVVPSGYQLTRRAFAAEHTFLCFKGPRAFFDLDLYPSPSGSLDKIESLTTWFLEEPGRELERRYGAAERVKAEEIEVLEDGFTIRRIHAGGLLSRRRHRVESWVWPRGRTGRVYVGTTVREVDGDGELQEELRRILASAKPEP
ncbi:MAG: hypothetical protein QW057_05445, partial [Candidatus Bathyarchaeia archaeon]